MNKQGLYITLINSFLGIGASLLLKDNAVIAWIIITLIIITVSIVEQQWLKENVFRNKRNYVLTAYSVLIVIFLTGLFFVTAPMRKTSAIISRTNGFLTGIKTGDYNTAYSYLSSISQASYPLDDFIKDHSSKNLKIRDFTIDQVTFNSFDRHKALVIVSSPFSIYGHETLNLELIKEKGIWEIVFSKNTIESYRPPLTTQRKKSGWSIANFFN